jgi:pentapeptide MXKDX repeat protein
MRIRHTLIAASLAAVLGALIVPAFAQGPQTMPKQGMGGGDMGRGMMSGGTMSGDMWAAA